MAKIKGAVVAEFLKEWPLGSDWSIEEEYTDLYDEDTEECVVDLEREYAADRIGLVQWQGSGKPKRVSMGGRTLPSSNVLDLGAAILLWDRTRTVKSFAVEVPVSHIQEFFKVVKQRGWTIR